MYPRDERGVVSRLLSESTAAWEIMGGLGLRRALARRMPRGDGHPVLLVPGFTATERTMGQMARFLRDGGYTPQGWGQGRNMGVSPAVIERLVERVVALADETSQRVSIIGWSGGGMYARAVANTVPAQVRQVITLGTPFKLTEDTLHYLPQGISRLHDRLQRKAEELPPDLADSWGESPPVPSTSIYSERDALAPWPFCLDRADEQSENIHVSVSHSSMPCNALVYYIIADRLAQRHWQPFRIDALRSPIFRHACATDLPVAVDDLQGTAPTDRLPPPRR